MFTILAFLLGAAVIAAIAWAMPNIIEAFRSNYDEAKAERQKRIVFREVQQLRDIELSTPKRMKLEIDIVVNKLQKEILNEDS